MAGILFTAVNDLVDAIDKASPSELDQVRAIAASLGEDFEINASKRATYKRLMRVLRDEMGPL